MIQKAKIIKVTTRDFILIDHVGLMLYEGGETYVYHNTNNPDNAFGGNILRQRLDDFMIGREYEETMDVWIDLMKFYKYIQLNREREYNVLSYNCEHFISEALSGSRSSPQLAWWGFGSLVTVGVIGIIGYKIIKN